ncbi:Mfs transporter [Aspergillus sclerotialis]|uniref:Mfs transporter n=1 Tax=Aspergillus sclerotialis TaxID=2070753 RepID=A0A3A2ZZL9_9EURO|nr:Mfs transporter [Aspergillus sclerotialis]
MTSDTTPVEPVPDEKAVFHNKEALVGGDAHFVAEGGQAATDQYGRALVEFDRAAERRLLWKIDLYIVPSVALMYLFCFIDRANIGNAKLAGLEDDLGLKGYDYNTALSVFFISYIVFEIPCNIACKWLGPGWFLPTTTLGFGICSLGTAFVNDLKAMCGVRFLLGVFEAGMMPGIAYYLSRWYRRSELAFRLALYILMAPLAGAFGGLLASAILTLDHFGSLHTWRQIFAIEGIITIGIGLMTFITCTDRPETARWLSQEEKNLAVARVKSERIATTEVLDKIDLAKTMRGIFNPITIVSGFTFLLNNITVQGLAFFAPTIVKTIYPHDSVVSQQLHTVPPYVVGGFFTVLFPWLSWHFDRRLIFYIIAPPLMIAGYIMFLATDLPHVRYGATFLIASGSFAFGALCNANSSAKRRLRYGTLVRYRNNGHAWQYWRIDCDLVVLAIRWAGLSHWKWA